VIRRRSHRHLLLQGGTVLTQDGARRVLEADVLITDGQIAGVAPNITPPSATRLLVAKGMAVIPGFIQPRALLGHALLRGLEHLGIGDPSHDDETAFWSGRLGAVECLTHGVTTVAGFGLSRGMDGMRRALTESGIRAAEKGATEAGYDVFSQGEMDAEEWLDAVTLGNARSLGLGAKLGSIEPGKAGDLTVLDVRNAAFFSHPDAPWPLRIRRSLDRTSLRWVVVDGEVLVDRGRLPHLDPEHWTQPAQDAARKLVERANERGM
jgi:cytosine/adenosine deaminase-related metal-dependent hydrolase